MMSQAMLGHGKIPASDHLRSSSSSVNGVPLRDLGRNRLFYSKRGFSLSVAAKLRKVKKHEYPWPEDPDPNVKGGILSHLSHFKPLKQKPKPVTLEFEKPLLDLQKKIVDVRKMANETGLDFSDQILSLENKYEQALRDLYLHLTPIQRVNIARHPNRPTFLDHVFNITEKFVELHGDRGGYDDPAIVTGLGTIDGRSYMFIGQQKGRNTKENIERNFGMPTPNGYRKALRMMYYADHHGFPIVTFIDTPGAYADLRSEELGQGEAIAHNLRTMFGLKVPIVSFVIGEGGSGGALAIGCANKLLMLENAVFYVASPEACAAILWKTAKASPKAAEKLKITAKELIKLGIADGVVPEPLGGAHADPSWTSQQIRKAIVESMDELVKMDVEELLRHRTKKFRHIGGFQEGLPVEPIRKVNMKKKEEPLLSKISKQELENEVEKLKEQILKVKDFSTETPTIGLDEMIEKLNVEVDHEFSEAAVALGVKDRLMMLREELTKARNSQDELVHPVLLDKVQRFKEEFRDRLSSAPNYENLNYKLDMLKELSKAKKLSEANSKTAVLKQEVSKKFNEVMDRADVKQKFEMIKAEVEKLGASTVQDFDDGLKRKIVELKNEIEGEFASAFSSIDLELEVANSNGAASSEASLPPNLKNTVGELDYEIQRKIEDAVSSSDLKHKIDMLKSEAAKAGMNPSPESQSRIQGLIKEIKEKLTQTLRTSESELVEKPGRLKSEIGGTVAELDGNGGSSPNNETRVEVEPEGSYA